MAAVAKLGSFVAVPDQDTLCIGFGADLYRDWSVAARCSQTAACHSVAAGLAGLADHKIVHIGEDLDEYYWPLPSRNLRLNTFDRI